jgi:SAM-dependent methyltransferase
MTPRCCRAWPGPATAPARRRRRLERFFGPAGYPRDLEATTAAFDTGAEADLVGRLAGQAGWPALDLGCGFGRHLRELAARGGVAAGADIVLDCCARSARYAPVVCCDHGRLPFGDAAFGVVYSYFTSVGYWADGLAAVLSEAARVLRAGGFLVLEVAARPAWPGVRIWSEPVPGGRRAAGVAASLPWRGATWRATWLFTRQAGRVRCYRLAYTLFSRASIIRAASAAGLRRRPGLEPADGSGPRHTYVFARPGSPGA